MAYTGTAALVTTITGMNVTGVKTTFAYRPDKVSSTQLPLLFVRLPETKGVTSTLGYQQGLKGCAMEIVIFAEFLNLSKAATIDALVRTLIDNLVSALETNAAALGLDSYEITTDEDTVDDGDRPVQVIVARIEVSG